MDLLSCRFRYSNFWYRHYGNGDRWGERKITDTYNFPQGSTILNLRYYISDAFKTDILNVEITSEEVLQECTELQDNKIPLRAGELYEINFRHQCSRDVSNAIDTAFAHFPSIFLTEKDVQDLRKQYDFKRPTIRLQVTATCRYKNEPVESSIKGTFPHWDIDPLMSFAEFKELAFKRIEKERRSDMMKFSWDRLELAEVYRSRQYVSAMQPISNTFYCPYDSLPLINRLQDGHRVMVDFILFHPNYVCITLVRGTHVIYIEKTQTVISLKSAAFRHFENYYGFDTRKVLLEDETHKTLKLKDDAPIHSVLHHKATLFYTFRPIPTDEYTDKEIFDKAEHVIGYVDRFPISTESWRKRLILYERREKCYDTEIVLTRKDDSILYSHHVMMAFLLLHTDMQTSPSILQLFCENREKFQDTKERKMRINLDSKPFSEFTHDQHEKSLEYLIKYCYLNRNPCSLDFLIQHFQCLLMWCDYFGFISIRGHFRDILTNDHVLNHLSRLKAAESDEEAKRRYELPADFEKKQEATEEEQETEGEES